jgi:hypothetical protein
MTVLESPGTVDPAILSTPSKIVDELGFETLRLTSPAPTSVVFATPQLDRNICCPDATCSVCLSPLLHRSALVQTRCKVSSHQSSPCTIISSLCKITFQTQHVFHEKCLREAKCQKAECPNCRAPLTPPQAPLLVAPITIDYSAGQRDAIIARSLAARNAVRYYLPIHHSCMITHRLLIQIQERFAVDINRTFFSR